MCSFAFLSGVVLCIVASCRRSSSLPTSFTFLYSCYFVVVVVVVAVAVPVALASIFRASSNSFGGTISRYFVIALTQSSMYTDHLWVLIFLSCHQV
jgi:hypothetical protein